MGGKSVLEVSARVIGGRVSRNGGRWLPPKFVGKAHPERKDNLCGRNKTRLELWEERLKDPIVALDKALKCVEISC